MRGKLIFPLPLMLEIGPRDLSIRSKHPTPEPIPNPQKTIFMGFYNVRKSYYFIDFRVLPTVLCITRVPGAQGDQKRLLDPMNWSH